MKRSVQDNVAVAVLAILGLAGLAMVLGGLAVHRAHSHALQHARSLVVRHLKAVGEGDIEAALANYGDEVLHGFHTSPEKKRGDLASLHGLRKCEEYCAYGSLWTGTRGMGWYLHLTYFTAYTNQPPNTGYKEMFEVFQPVVGTNCVIVWHGYD